MLIHDKFTFLHMPKTGGIFLSEFLEGELGMRSATEDRHAGWSEIPSQMREKPVLVYVRNPWDWYVSHYHYTLSQLKQFKDWTNLPAFPRAVFGEGRDFETALANSCSRFSDHDDPLVAEAVAEDPDAPVLELMYRGHDYYTANFLTMVGEGLSSERLIFGRFESLVDDLERALRRIGVPVAAGAIAELRGRKPTNTTDHPHYRSYYDDRLRDLVGACCREITDRFGYRF